MVEPGARRLTTERPEVTRSGLNHPSGLVGPTLLNGAMVSSPLLAVPLSSTAPTVMTIGSSPGLRMVPLNGPALPADVTTVMPAFHTACTAWSSGLVTVDWLDWYPRERLRTRMP